MPLDAPVVLDDDRAAAAFAALEDTLNMIPHDALQRVRLDLSRGATAALALVERARREDARPRIEAMPSLFWEAATLDRLEEAAWAAWHTVVEGRKAAKAGARTVSAETDTASAALRDRMLRVLDYHLHDAPAVALELSDIRRGSGYIDRATDLWRLAQLYDAHRPALAGDARHWSPDDAQSARALASAILQAVGQGGDNPWTDAQRRAWTHMLGLYNEAARGLSFIFHGTSVHDLQALPSMFTLLRSRPRVRVSGDDGPAEDSGQGGEGDGLSTDGAA